MLDMLRQQLIRLQKPAGIADAPAVLPLGVPAVDDVLGGGLLSGALHEIAATSEAHLPAATGFTLGLAALATGNKNFVWIAEDMALTENGAPYGAGLDVFGLSPERLVIVAVAHRHELMAAMEEALRCRAVGVVIGEVRNGTLDAVAVRRLSLAASDSGTLAFFLRTQPTHDASTAVTRWVVGASPSVIPGHARQSASPNGSEFGAPRFAVHLTRNRRGPSASWILEWRNPDDRFVLAAPHEPVAAPLRHRPHQKVA
ncbi:ImuA family protein [Undibacter mobilis]|uniref:DNA repair protein n=1 Tax=Undibacter mobilis TaxID=2292256 RepID=A0A371B6X9_9BRAD|nr:DNA repair protein [Undibacter mobilis]RDV03304.1 DNA repair protein [Undibacter mobilis]